MSRLHRKRNAAGLNRDPQIARLFEHIVQGVESPERVVELCYWSRDPELLEAIRMFAAMTPDSQAAVATFFAIVGNAESIAANLDRNGKLTLTSPDMGEALADVIEPRETWIEVPAAISSRIH